MQIACLLIYLYIKHKCFLDVFISRKVNSKGRSAELYPIFHIEFACLEYVRLICGCIFTHSKHVLRTERKWKWKKDLEIYMMICEGWICKNMRKMINVNIWMKKAIITKQSFYWVHIMSGPSFLVLWGLSVWVVEKKRRQGITKMNAYK